MNMLLAAIILTMVYMVTLSLAFSVPNFRSVIVFKLCPVVISLFLLYAYCDHIGLIDDINEKTQAMEVKNE